MYVDRKHVRDNTVIVRFNEEELDAINALARYSRKQRAKLLYDMVMNQISQESQQLTAKAG